MNSNCGTVSRTFTRQFPAPNVPYCIDERAMLGCAEDSVQAALKTPAISPFIYVIVGAQGSGTSTVLRNLEAACRNRGISTWWSDMKVSTLKTDTFRQLTAGDIRGEIMFVDSFRVVGLGKVPGQIRLFSSLHIAAVFIIGSLFQTNTLMMHGIPRLSLWELNLVQTVGELPTVPCTPWYRNFSAQCIESGHVDFEVLRQKVNYHLDEFIKYNMGVSDLEQPRAIREQLIKDLTETTTWDRRRFKRAKLGIGLVGQLVKMVPDLGARYFKTQLVELYDEIVRSEQLR